MEAGDGHRCCANGDPSAEAHGRAGVIQAITLNAGMGDHRLGCGGRSRLAGS